MVTILWPYVVWSVIQGLLLVMLSRYTNSSTGWSALTQILWNPISPFWFLYALFVFMMVARFVPPRPLLALSAVLFLCGDMMPHNTLANEVLHFPLFFSLGVVMGSLDRPQAMRVAAPVAAAAFAVAAMAIGIALPQGYTHHDSALMLPAALGGGLVVIWLAQQGEGAARLATLGRLSMAIYMMHILAAAGTRIVLQKVVQLPPIVPIYLVAGTLAALHGLCLHTRRCVYRGCCHDSGWRSDRARTCMDRWPGTGRIVHFHALKIRERPAAASAVAAVRL